MSQLSGDDSSTSIDEIYLRYKSTARPRRLNLEAIAWTLGIMLVAYMLFAAVAGIIYAG